MISNTLARRYAKALYQVSSSPENAQNELIMASRLINENPSLRQFLSAPQIAKEDKEDVLKKLLGDSQVMDFLSYLLEKGRIKQLDAIAKAYQSLFEEKSEVVEATLIAALPLTPSLKEQVKQMLETGFQKQFALEHRVEPAILGGLVLFIGNRMMDFSIRQKLQSLKLKLASYRLHARSNHADQT